LVGDDCNILLSGKGKKKVLIPLAFLCELRLFFTWRFWLAAHMGMIMSVALGVILKRCERYIGVIELMRDVILQFICIYEGEGSISIVSNMGI